jgi:hypothetical protein
MENILLRGRQTTMVLPVTEESQGVMLEEMGRNDAPVKLS